MMDFDVIVAGAGPAGALMSRDLARAGFKVPRGFCLTTWAYEAFVNDAKIPTAIGMELGRKSMDEMRWEEISDAALRIRAMFLSHPLSDRLRETLADGLCFEHVPYLLNVCGTVDFSKSDHFRWTEPCLYPRGDRKDKHDRG